MTSIKLKDLKEEVAGELNIFIFLWNGFQCYTLTIWNLCSKVDDDAKEVKEGLIVKPNVSTSDTKIRKFSNIFYLWFIT